MTSQIVFPNEIYGLIVDQFAVPINDFDLEMYSPPETTLRVLTSLALVSHLFRQYAQQHIFASVYLLDTDGPIPLMRRIRRLAQIIEQDSCSSFTGIASFIRRLYLVCKRDRSTVILRFFDSDSPLCFILNKVFQSPTDRPCFLSISIKNFQRPGQPNHIDRDIGLYWPRLSEEFKRTFTKLACQSNMIALQLHGIGHIPKDVISQRLRFVDLDRTSRTYHRLQAEFNAPFAIETIAALDVSSVGFDVIPRGTSNSNQMLRHLVTSLYPFRTPRHDTAALRDEFMRVMALSVEVLQLDSQVYETTDYAGVTLNSLSFEFSAFSHLHTIGFAIASGTSGSFVKAAMEFIRNSVPPKTLATLQFRLKLNKSDLDPSTYFASPKLYEPLDAFNTELDGASTWLIPHCPDLKTIQYHVEITPVDIGAAFSWGLAGYQEFLVTSKEYIRLHLPLLAALEQPKLEVDIEVLEPSKPIVLRR